MLELKNQEIAKLQKIIEEQKAIIEAQSAQKPE